MPRRDGTGPQGEGSLTGRGMGNCAEPTNPTSAQTSNTTTNQGVGVGRRGFWNRLGQRRRARNGRR